jgi:hypothetical protein
MKENTAYPRYENLRKLAQKLLDLPEVVEAERLEGIVGCIASEATFALRDFLVSYHLEDPFGNEP